MTNIAALLFCVLLLGLAIFQLGLISGLPLGRFAWGGQHRVLPARLRFSGAIAILVYGALALAVLDRADFITTLPKGWSQPAAWMIAIYLASGVVLNAISRSRSERLLMTPVALLLLSCVLLVAIS